MLLSYDAVTGKGVTRVVDIAVAAAEPRQMAVPVWQNANGYADRGCGQASLGSRWTSGLAAVAGRSMRLRLLPSMTCFDARADRVRAVCSSGMMKDFDLRIKTPHGASLFLPCAALR